MGCIPAVELSILCCRQGQQAAAARRKHPEAGPAAPSGFVADLRPGMLMQLSQLQGLKLLSLAAA